MTPRRCGHRVPTVQLVAEDRGVCQVPVGRAEGRPGPLDLELHAPLTGAAAVDQPELCRGKGCRRRSPRGPCCFFPSHPGWGSRGPLSASSPPASAAAPSTYMCAGLCANLGVTSLCPQSLLPLLPAGSPQKQHFLKGKGSPPGRRPLELGQLHPERVGVAQRGLAGRGQGPLLGPLSAPLLASPEHLSPASWPCPHWCPGSRWQWNSRDSLPAQRKASAQTSPEPWPKWAPWGVDTAAPHCSSRHTTWAVARSRSASQTVPQVRPRLTSCLENIL